MKKLLSGNEAVARGACEAGAEIAEGIRCLAAAVWETLAA